MAFVYHYNAEMTTAIQQQGLLRIVPPAVLDAAIKERDSQHAAADKPPEVVATNLAGYIRGKYDVFRNHRNDGAAGWNERLLAALRAFNGQYDAAKLAEIKKFQGSEVYARLVAMKCRGASSLLRDVYLGNDRPWGIAPSPDPDVPPEIVNTIQTLVASELETLNRLGQPPVDAAGIRDRVMQLMEGARQAARKQAGKRADIAEDKIDEILIDGNFYKAMAEFLVDLPLFPFACIKGPVVKIVPSVSWAGGAAAVTHKPRLFWQRISPFDLYWTPGVSDIESADMVERSRLTRGDLNDLLDLPGYDHDEVRAVLDEYGRGGLTDNWDSVDSERAVGESRESPTANRSGMIACLEFTGNIQGRMLREQGMTAAQIPDELRDYKVKAWLIGRHIIKTQLSPSPRQRHEYFITSFEKVPGTVIGNGLPDILSDIQDVCNAALRSLVNNLSIASGPQVVVNDDRLAPGEDGEGMWPWKRWHVSSDPMGSNAQVPISFFMPESNAQELLAVYKEFSSIGDELSAIPKYLTGSGTVGGAGRTSSGLAMLMSNSSKILQTVSANIDRDVLDPLLHGLYDMLMLTDTSGLLQGDESIRVLGVNVAMQRETQRSRQLEFLQVTANPIDTAIMGTKGRGAVLRSVSHTIGLDGDEVVPSEEDLEAMQAQQAAMGQEEAAAQAQGGQKGPTSTGDAGPRFNAQTKISGGVH